MLCSHFYYLLQYLQKPCDFLEIAPKYLIIWLRAFRLVIKFSLVDPRNLVFSGILYQQVDLRFSFLPKVAHWA